MLGSSPPASGIYDVAHVCESGDNGFHSGVSALKVRCNNVEDGGGWIVILRRKRDVSKQENFNCSWIEYERGFGDLNTEFWYGLRNIHCLTTREQVDPRIELTFRNGTMHTWIYQNFSTVAL